MTTSPVPLPYIWRTPQYLLPSPVRLLLAPITRAWASNWPNLLPLGCGLEGPGGKEQIHTSHPPLMTFSQWNVWFLITVTQHWLLLTEAPAAQDEMTDRLGSLWACPPRRRERGKRRVGICARPLKVTHRRYLQSPSGLLLVRLGYSQEFKWLNYFI